MTQVVTRTGVFADRLAEAVERRRSQLVLGLDPVLDLLPVELQGEAAAGPASRGDAVARFCRGLIDAAAPFCVAVKPQLAFFEALGSHGLRAFEAACSYAREAGLLVIADAKRGHIGSAARAYAAAYLEPRDGGRARVHERPGQRARRRVPCNRLRVPRARRRLANGRRRRGCSPARRDPGSLGLVMRRLLVAAIAALLLAAPAHAAHPPAVDARAYLVVDGGTGEVLAARNAHARMPIASVTKLMTVLVALEHLKLGDTVSIPPVAAGVGESSIGLRTGERLTVHDLLEGALVQSANDAAYALAASAGGGDVSSFVREMNTKARP